MRVCPTLHITACGSGNFLIQAYKHLRGLEYELIQRAEELELEEIQAQLAKIEHQRMSKTKKALIARRDELQAGASLQFDEQVLRKSKVSMRQFYGIEINAWPAKVAATSMLLVDHLANQAWGENVVRLPIEETPQIVQGNALRVEWGEIVSDHGGTTYIFGNPPFLGHDSRSTEQAQELRDAWQRKDISRLDYVTAWHAKSLSFFAQGRAGAFAYVTTNSIVQGDQVPRVFGPIFDAGWRIRFAHRTFAWDSEAAGKAAVHCVIVGFDRQTEPHPRLWDYLEFRGGPVEAPVERGINAYLVDGPNVLATTRSAPINPEIPKVSFGNTPRDGGHLVIEEADHASVMADPVAAKYVRPFVGARELLHSKSRWCLWLVDLDPADLAQSQILRERLNQVQHFRENSKSKDAQKAAATPHLFWWRSHPGVDYLCIPSVVSENRRYFTAQRLPAEVISSNAVFTAPDPDGLQFALVSSSLFITWQKTVGGRLKSDLRFSGTLVWNNFPVPELDEKTRTALIKAGEGVLSARNLHPKRSLAEHYNPLAMDPALIKAHDVLDREVDKAFGATRKLTTERQRQELLFANYFRMTSGSEA